MRRLMVVLSTIPALWFFSGASAEPSHLDSTHWIVSWGTSPVPPSKGPAELRQDGFEFSHETVREVVHLSAGGAMVRIRFSNAYGQQDLKIRNAHIAFRANDSKIKLDSDRALTFDGSPSASVPANAFLLSDPVAMLVPSGSDLAVSVFLDHPTFASGIHYAAHQTSYVGRGDQTSALSIASARELISWVFLAGVDVRVPNSVASVAAFGDSLTDGDGSTTDSNHRWPDFLAKRLLQTGHRLGVVNGGIGGNRILQDPVKGVPLGDNAIARFCRDALDQPGVKYVVFVEGLNDIGLQGTKYASPDDVEVKDLIAGIKQVIQRSHDRGVKIFGSTLLPFEDADLPGYYSPEKEAKRQVLNQWIRSSHAFDAVLDFDKIIADPAQPAKIRTAFDSGDHLHPNDAGYKAMAESIDLHLFQ